VSVPAEVLADASEPFSVEAQSTQKVLWHLCSDDGIKTLFTHENTGWFFAKKPGRYRIVAVAARGSAPVLAECKVTVKGGPTPPPPGPDPVPVDPLTRTLQQAYNADASTQDKPGKLRKLQAIMAEASSLARQTSVIDSTAQLAAAVRKLADAEVGVNTFTPVRNAVGAHLNAEIGTRDVKLTAELRDKISAAYAKVANSLKDVQP
jgi:hypothetical protein